MPKISIIIPIYNTQDFFPECIESIQTQTMDDLEVIIVDDGSTDESGAMADRFAQEDKRFKVIHQENQGQHLARAKGLELATGTYTMFLDPDDKLDAQACEKTLAHMEDNPVDILHFGVKTIVTADELLPAAQAFEEFANRNLGRLEGADIRNSIFLESWGYRLDWRVWQRLYGTEFLKRAFSLMSNVRLWRAEDSHEGLVIACAASTFDSMDDYQGYIYRYGCGVSTGGNLSKETYDQHCQQFKSCLEASFDFARKNPELVDDVCIEGLKSKCLEILSNDWKDRVAPDQQREAYQSFANAFGGANAVRELYRLIRDASYASYTAGGDPALDAQWKSYVEFAETFDASNGTDYEKKRMADVRMVAKNHITDLAVIETRKAYEDQKAKIFVTMHDYFDKPADPLFQPVQVGPGQFSEQTRFHTTFHDGDGDNIANANARYCEMTVQYWAWKNVEADYYGFCHYRRYFNLSNVDMKENDWGEIEDKYLDERTCKRYGLDSESFFSKMGDADVMLTEIKDVSKFPDHNKSVYEHYRNAEYLHIEDLNTLIDVIADLQPDYLEDASRYLAGSKTCFCNMYVMKRDAFHSYCAWLFPILEEFERRADMSHYNQQEMRVTGHLAERLFNIFLWHNQRSNAPWKTKEVQCVRFEDPSRVEPLHRAFDKPAVPVVFAADDNYSPMLGTAIASLAQNASDETLYDIVVLSRGISGRNQTLIRRALDGKPNISLRFFNVGRLVANYKLTVNEHITEETYYRFLIQWILPDYPKVLYLDSDLVVNADVAELFATELGDALLAAVVDVDWAGNCNLRSGDDRCGYARKTLGMKDPYAYFQAGVLLLNTAGMARLHTLEEWLKLAAVPHIYNDQDVLNAECEGRVRYLDLSWNVLVDTGRVEAAIKHAPVQMFKDYLASRENPRIVHYAGGIKAWNEPDTDFADLFWWYARQTPFYETLLKRMGRKTTSDSWPLMKDSFLYEQGSRSLPRKVVDVVLPYGSERREIVKKLAGRE